MLAQGISFAVVEIQQRFAYYFFQFMSAKSEHKMPMQPKDSSEDVDERTKKSILHHQNDTKRQKIIKLMIVLNFVMPAVILVLFIKPLSFNLVKKWVSLEVYRFIRIILCIVACGLRALTFRQER